MLTATFHLSFHHLLGYCLVPAILSGVGISPWPAIAVNVTDPSGTHLFQKSQEAQAGRTEPDLNRHKQISW